MAVKAEFDDVIGEFKADQIVKCTLDVRKMETGPSKEGGIYKTLVPKGEILLIPGKSRDYYIDELQSQWGGGEYRLYPKDFEGEAIGDKIMIINVPLSEEEERLARMNEELEVQKRKRAVALAKKDTLDALTEQQKAERDHKKEVEAEKQPEKKESGLLDLLEVAKALKPNDSGSDKMMMMMIQMQKDRQVEDDHRREREEAKEEKRRVREEERRREDEKIRKEEKAEAERIRKDERERWEKEVEMREKELNLEREKAVKLLEMKDKELTEERADRRKTEFESQKNQLNFMNILAKKDQDNSHLVTTMLADHLAQTRKLTESQINMTDKHVQSTMANLDMLREREGYAHEEESGGALNEITKGLVEVVKGAANRPRVPAMPIQPQPGQVGPPKPVLQEPEPAPGVSLDETGAATTLIQRIGQYAPAEIAAILGYMRDKNYDAARLYAEQTLDSEYGPLAALTIKTAEWPEIHDALKSTIDTTAKNAKATLAIIETPEARTWWEKFRAALSEFSEEVEEGPEEEVEEPEPEEEVFPESPEPEKETPTTEKQEEDVEKSES